MAQVDRRGTLLGNANAFKAPCVVATVGAISLAGLQTIDGIALASGDRVLVTQQTDQRTNGIYVAASGPWQRAHDADESTDFLLGTVVLVTNGSLSPAGVFFQQTSPNPITIGESALTFVVYEGKVYARTFGAIGNFLTDDRPALQRAANYCVAHAATLCLGKGVFRVTSPGVVFNWSGLSYETPRGGIVGDGQLSTVLFGDVGNYPVLSLVDSGQGAHQVFADFSIEKGDLSGAGLLCNKMAFADYQNILVSGCGIGFELLDCLSSVFLSCQARFNVRGCSASFVSSSSPNAMSFYSCVFGVNGTGGIAVDQATTLVIQGGSIEGNGTSAAPGTGYGLWLTNAGPGGAGAATIQGVYFEANQGSADLRIENGLHPAAYSILGCNFNRVSATSYTTNNILVLGDVFDQKIVLHGNGFQALGPYVADAGRPYIAITAPSGKVFIDNKCNIYGDPVETPDLSAFPDDDPTVLHVINNLSDVADKAAARINLGLQIGVNVFTQRTFTGTANRITVTNGDGTGGNPTFDIAASYVGQASITTLGTIATGAWQGTKVGLAYGGTNADLSATGGTSQVLMQTGAGAAITVRRLAAADLSDAATLATLTGAQTLTNKTIDAASNTISDLTTAMFAANVVDNDGTLAANSSTRLPTQAAVKAYADGIIAAADAMVFKGVIDCSANPNYPAADRGHTYKVSVAGKIGGASGVNVEVGDTAMCITDGTPSGNQATVGAAWNIVQANLDGAVIGPASATSGNIATFSGTSGKLIQDGGKALPAGAVVGTTDAQALTNKTINGLTVTASTGTLTIANGKTLTASNSLTLAGTDGTTLTFQATGTVVNRDSTDTLTNKTFDTAGTGNVFKINGTGITAKTGTGNVVLDTSPTLTTPVLGVATATTLKTGDGAAGTPALFGTTDVTSGVYFGSHLVALAAGGNPVLKASDTSSLALPPGNAFVANATTIVSAAGSVGFSLVPGGAGAGGVIQSTFAFGNGLNSNFFFAAQAEGTKAAPTAILANEPIFSFGGLGYDGTGYGEPAADVSISFVSAQNFAVGAHGTQLVFSTTPNGSATIAVAMTVQNSGGVSIGAATADPGVGKLAVTTAYKVGSTQVVAARQTGWTAATGTATRTTFATSSVTLATLAEHVKALIDDLTTHGLIGT